MVNIRLCRYIFFNVIIYLWWLYRLSIIRGYFRKKFIFCKNIILKGKLCNGFCDMGWFIKWFIIIILLWFKVFWLFVCI